MAKKAVSLFVAVGLALVGIPVGAQELPNSITGTVPGGLEGVADAVLQDASGRTVSTTTLTEGKFAFRNVPPGEYYIALYSTAGQRIARSCALSLAIGAAREASFDCPAPAAAPPAAPTTTAPAATAAAGGGLGTTGWILVGAAAVGITTAIVIATSQDDAPVSPIH